MIGAGGGVGQRRQRVKGTRTKIKDIHEENCQKTNLIQNWDKMAKGESRKLY